MREIQRLVEAGEYEKAMSILESLELPERTIAESFISAFMLV